MFRVLSIFVMLTLSTSTFAQSLSGSPTASPPLTQFQQSIPARDAMSRAKNSTLSGECRYKNKDAPCGCGSDNLCVGVCDGLACRILK